MDITESLGFLAKAERALDAIRSERDSLLVQLEEARRECDRLRKRLAQQSRNDAKLCQPAHENLVEAGLIQEIHRLLDAVRAICPENGDAIKKWRYPPEIQE